MQKAIGNHGAFWAFTFMAVVDLFFVLFLVPETKGHSLEDIEKIFIEKQPNMTFSNRLSPGMVESQER